MIYSWALTESSLIRDNNPIIQAKDFRCLKPTVIAYTPMLSKRFYSLSTSVAYGMSSMPIDITRCHNIIILIQQSN